MGYEDNASPDIFKIKRKKRNCAVQFLFLRELKLIMSQPLSDGIKVSDCSVGIFGVKLEKTMAKLESELKEGCHPQKRILAVAKISNKCFYR